MFLFSGASSLPISQPTLWTQARYPFWESNAPVTSKTESKCGISWDLQVNQPHQRNRTGKEILQLSIDFIPGVKPLIGIQSLMNQTSERASRLQSHRLVISCMNFLEIIHFQDLLLSHLFFVSRDVSKRPGIPQRTVFFVPYHSSLEITSEPSLLQATSSVCFAFWCSQGLRFQPVIQACTGLVIPQTLILTSFICVEEAQGISPLKIAKTRFVCNSWLSYYEAECDFYCQLEYA